MAEKVQIAAGIRKRGQKLFATPSAADSVGSHGGGQGRSLRTDIYEWKREMWPTPNASDADKWSNQSFATRIANGQQVRLSTAVSINGGAGGQLNPDWVEWLMGFPIGWTNPDAKPDMATYHHVGEVWPDEPGGVPRVAHGVPDRVNRLKALGNAVVPQVAEFLGRAIMEAEAQSGGG